LICPEFIATAIYNQLLRIEEELGGAAIYPGMDAWFNL
jgi:enolase